MADENLDYWIVKEGSYGDLSYGAGKGKEKGIDSSKDQKRKTEIGGALVQIINWIIKDSWEKQGKPFKIHFYIDRSGVEISEAEEGLVQSLERAYNELYQLRAKNKKSSDGC